MSKQVSLSDPLIQELDRLRRTRQSYTSVIAELMRTALPAYLQVLQRWKSLRGMIEQNTLSTTENAYVLDAVEKHIKEVARDMRAQRRL